MAGQFAIPRVVTYGSLTVVPLFSPVRSRVVPAGTATEDKTIVEQEVLDLMADAAPLEPEKVQVEDRRSSADAAVGAGAA